jgi:hypothetical protein
MKFKLILTKNIYRTFRLVFTFLLRLSIMKLDKKSFYAQLGEDMGICILSSKLAQQKKMRTFDVDFIFQRCRDEKKRNNKFSKI